MNGKRKGQGLVEFALTLPVLLTILLGITETALVIQGHLTAQHAAREAARFAVTYQPIQGACLDQDGDGVIEDGINDSQDGGDPDDLAPWPYCPVNNDAYADESDASYYNRRVELIKRTARHAATGLRIDETHLHDFDYEDVPGFFGVKVWGYPSFQVDCNADPSQCLDHPGIEGLPVRVLVQHNVEIMDPLYQAIVDYVPVQATAQMINEGIQVGFGDVPPPSFDTNPNPDDPPVATNTPPPGGPTPTTEPTPTLIPGYTVELNFEQAVNQLPEERPHGVIATVRDELGNLVQGALVSFSIDEMEVGGFSYSGAEIKYLEETTDAQGEASVTAYGNYSGTATIHAWLDYNTNNVLDPGEPQDEATKTWTATGPYVTVSDHEVLPLDYIYADVMDHDPGNNPYRLLWCVISGTANSMVVQDPVNVDAGTWDETDIGFEIPVDSEGVYRLESHSGSGDCGDTDLVAHSANIHIQDTLPDLSITSITGPDEICPETLFTVTIDVENLTAGTVESAFDVDFYVDPEQAPPQRPIGEDKQWISGMDPSESVTLNALLWIPPTHFEEHTIWARVDTSDGVEETDEENNIISFTLTAPVVPRVDFSDYNITSYSDQDLDPVHAVEDGGTTLHLGPGNTWKKIPFPLTVEADTVLEFDFRAGTEGEIHAIGLDSNNDHDDAQRGFDLYGTQNWGIGDFRNYSGSGWQHYEIPIGQHYTGDMNYLFFINDDDGDQAGESWFANVAAGVPECMGETPDPPPWPIDENPPGSKECYQILEAGGFEGNPSAVLPYWSFDDAAWQSNYAYGGTMSMRLHSSLGSFPGCEPLAPYLYQTVEIPSTISSTETASATTTLYVRGQRLIAESQADCSVPTSVDADDELYVQLRNVPGDPSHLITSGAPASAALLPQGDEGTRKPPRQSVRKGVLVPISLMPEPSVNAQVQTIHSASFEDDLDGWTATDGTAVAGRNCYYDAHDGDCYARGRSWGSTDPDPTLYRTISTVEFESINLSYWRADRDCEGGWDGDHFVAEYSHDGGTTWTELQRASPVGWNWTQESFDLPADADNNPDFMVRFTFDGSWEDDYMAVDDITVTGVPAGPTVDFSSASYNVNESAGTAEITVELSETSDDTITVDYATSDGTATAGDDYTAASGTLTFAPDDTEETFTIDILPDTIYDGEDTVILTLSNASNANIGPNSPATLVIDDDEAIPTMNFSSDAYSAGESAGAATITATLDVMADQPIVASYETSGGTATPGTDYTGGGGGLIFAPGETIKTFQVPILDDALIEGDETVNLTLQNSYEWVEDFDLSDGTTSDNGSTAWSVDTSQLGSGAVFEVQGGAFAASDTDGTGTTGGGAEGIWESEVINIAGASDVDISVDIWSEGNADDTDYVAVYYRLDGGSEVLIAERYNDIPSRETVSVTGLSGSTVQVIVRADLNYNDETYLWDDVTVNVGSGSVGVGSNSPATLTIVDDDHPVEVDFSSVSYTVTEDVGMATITATLSEAADWPVVAQYFSGDETAIAGEDYAAVEGILTFDPGVTEQTFQVPITDDLAYENSETLLLTLQSEPLNWVEDFDDLSDGATSDSGDTAWTVDTSQTSEGDFSVQDGVFRAIDTNGEGVWESEVLDISAAGNVDISVDIWSEGDANDQDYVQVYYRLDGGSEVLIAERYNDFSRETVSANALSGDTVQVIVRADLDHDDESYHWDDVSITGSTGGATIGPNSPTRLMIIDNDGTPTVNFSSTDYRVDEGAGVAVITATLSGTSYETVTVDYNTADGTATAGDDYTTTVGTLTFPPGTRAQTFEIPIIDDDDFFEGDETVALALSNPISATLGSDSATLTIEENDVPTVDFSAPEYSVDEGTGEAVITVTLNVPLTDTITVNYRTDDNTATAPDDYTSVNGTLTFDPGDQILTFTVPISDDEAYEGNEQLTLVLFDAVNAPIGPNSPAPLTIVDNEPIAPETWVPFEENFSGDVDVQSLVGQEIEVRFYATHDDDQYGTWFYLDNLEVEICNEWTVPDPEPGTASIGGDVRVLIGGIPEAQQGVDVWAYSQDGQVYRTVTIQDGSYHFYNIAPGTYTIYSEVWIGGNLRSATTTVTVGANERNNSVNLFLL